MAEESLYSALGLTPDATGPEIRAAYQQLTAQAVAGQFPAAQRQAIEEAYSTLGDPIRRLRYDAQASAPPPPRFQMPEIGLPNRRLRVRLPAIPTFRAIPMASIRRIDPMLGVAIGLVLVVAVIALFLTLFRGNTKNAGPAQSVADLVTPVAATAPPSPRTAPTASGPTATAIIGVGSPPGALPPIVGVTGPTGGLFGPGGAAGNPAITGVPGTNTVPGGGSPAILAPPPAQAPGPTGADANEPPFITTGVVVDTLRAVIAANAVRAASGQGTVTRPATSGPVAVAPAPAAVAPAGIPITVPGALPPVTALTPSAPTAAPVPRTPVPPPPEASQPGQFEPQPGTIGVVRNLETAPTAAAATSPNRIGVPAGPVTASGPASQTGPAGGSPAPSGPNRIATPAPTR